ncbi:MAG: S41 family peptidase [Mucilaginibacter sp.]
MQNLYKLYLSALLCLSAGTAPAQIYAYYKTGNKIRKYALQPDRQLTDTSFKFPVYSDFPSLSQSYALKNGQSLRLSDTKVRVPASGWHLTGRFFTRNVLNVTVTMLNRGVELPLARFAPNRQGYQYPLDVELKPDSLFRTPPDSIVVRISYHKADTAKGASLILGDLSIDQQSIVQHYSPSDLFTTLPFRNQSKSVAPKTVFEDLGQYRHFPSGQSEQDYKATIFIEGAQNDTPAYLDSVFMFLVTRYPFYKTRSLDREQVIDRARRLLQYSEPLCNRVNAMNEFLGAAIGDPHFYIYSRCQPRFDKSLVSPIVCYDLNGKCVIAAVNDRDLQTQVALGSVITEISGIDKQLLTGATALQVNNWLRKKAGEEVILGLKDAGGRKGQVRYLTKAAYPALPGRRDRSRLFIQINDTSSYYRVSSISDAFVNDFISNLDSISHSRKLILDFRNCGGGDFFAGARLLSCFVPGARKLFDFRAIATGKMDSVVAEAGLSPVSYPQKGQLVLLYNRNSACVAELLLYALSKYRSNTLRISSERSAGALAFTYQVVLPGGDDVAFTTNALSPGEILLDGRSIEKSGLLPDIMVHLDTVSDLAPYDDKLLQVALHAGEKYKAGKRKFGTR